MLFLPPNTIIISMNREGFFYDYGGAELKETIIASTLFVLALAALTKPEE